MRRRHSHGGGSGGGQSIGTTSKRAILRLASLLLVNLAGMHSPSELFFRCFQRSSSNNSSKTRRWIWGSDGLLFAPPKTAAATAARAQKIVTLDDLYPARVAARPDQLLADGPFSPRWVEALVADPSGCGSWKSVQYVWQDVGFAGNVNS